MKNLKPNSIEWLEFARSIGATHWNDSVDVFYRQNSDLNPESKCYYFRHYDSEWVPSNFLNSDLNLLDDISPIDFSLLDNKPSEPDWNKAPEWATKYGRISHSHGRVNDVFYNEEQYQYVEYGLTYLFNESNTYNFDDIEFKESRPTVNQQLTVPVVNKSFTTEKVASSKMEPTTWNGTGLPPVGTVCRIKESPRKQPIVAFILYIDEIRCVYRPEGSDISYHKGVAEMKFLPLETDRDRWIDDAVYQCILHYGNPKGAESYRSLCVKLYDAVLAKLPD